MTSILFNIVEEGLIEKDGQAAEMDLWSMS
jgi:hypothetical protein